MKAFSESNLQATLKLSEGMINRPFSLCYSVKPNRFGFYKRSMYLFGRYWWWFPTRKEPKLFCCTDPALTEKALQMLGKDFVDADGNPVS